jgi:hypothetical protein
MVVREVVRRACGGGSNEPSADVNALDSGLDKAGSPEGGADRLRAVPQLQPSGTGFEQERRQDKEILAAHERDLDVRIPAETSLEVSRPRDATESASQHNYAHILSSSRSDEGGLDPE